MLAFRNVNLMLSSISLIPIIYQFHFHIDYAVQLYLGCILPIELINVSERYFAIGTHKH